MSQIRRPHLNVLNGVSCPTAANCMAVGYYDAAGNRQAFAEQWNGATWTTLVIPHNGALRAVSCPAVNSCKAVGSYLSPGRRHTLTATWDGTAWTVQPSPDLGGLITEFTGVSCTGGSNCIANCIVGGDDSARSGPLRPLNGALERYGVAGADHPHPRWRRRPDLDLRPRAAAPTAAPGPAWPAIGGERPHSSSGFTMASANLPLIMPGAYRDRQAISMAAGRCDDLREPEEHVRVVFGLDSR